MDESGVGRLENCGGIEDVDISADPSIAESEEVGERGVDRFAGGVDGALVTAERGHGAGLFEELGHGWWMPAIVRGRRGEELRGAGYAALNPTLGQATDNVNAGLSLTRNGWAYFRETCAQGTMSSERIQTGLAAIRNAQDLFNAANILLTNR